MQTISDNVTTVTYMFDFFKQGEVDKLIAHMHPRIVWTVSGAEPIPYARTYKGHEDVAIFFPALAEAVSFMEFTPERISNIDERTVIAIGHFTAIVNATQKETKSDWVMLFEFDEEGTLVHFKDYVDTQNVATAFANITVQHC